MAERFRLGRIAAIDPVAFGRLIHGGTPRGSQLTVTTIRPRLDGSAGRPHTRAFTDRRAWRAALEAARDAEGHFFCFSSFVGACRDGSSAGAGVGAVRDLTALWQDLDWHKHPTAKVRFTDVRGVLAEVDRRCDAIGFPRPGLAIATGRGLQVAWPHRPVPAYSRDADGFGAVAGEGALATWNVMQRVLRGLLDDLGADPLAIPACHFFKLPGTVNPKSATTVATLRRHRPAERDSFGNLYAALAPAIRAARDRGELDQASLPSRRKPRVVVDLAVQRAARTGAAAAERGEDGKGATSRDAAALVWAPRLRALIGIAEHRAAAHGGSLPPGGRDGPLWLVGLAMAWCSRSGWEAEFLDLAARLCPWPEAECRDRLSAVAKRAGEEQGRDKGLYRMTSATLRAHLALTGEEERLDCASAIASPAVRRWHKTRRQGEARRTTGRPDRKATTGLRRAEHAAHRKTAADARAASAHEQRAQGRTAKEIAAALGCDPRVVRRYLAKPAPAASTSAEAAPAWEKASVVPPRKPAAADADRVRAYRACHLVIADGFTEPEAAEDLGVPVRTVRAWLAAREALSA